MAKNETTTTTTVETAETTSSKPQYQEFLKDSLVSLTFEGRTFVGRVVRQDHWIYSDRRMTKVCFADEKIEGVAEWLRKEGFWVCTEDLTSLGISEGGLAQTTDADGKVQVYTVVELDAQGGIVAPHDKDGNPEFRKAQVIAKIGFRKGLNQYKVKKSGLALIPVVVKDEQAEEKVEGEAAAQDEEKVEVQA